MKTLVNSDQPTLDAKGDPEHQGLGDTAAQLATIQSAGDGVIVTDLEGRVEFLNSAAERLIGVRSAEIAGRRLAEVLRLEEKHRGSVKGDLVELAILCEAPIALGKDLLMISYEGQTIQIEGEISVRSSGGAATGTVITFRDVTARNREELQRREEEKMRAVGKMAGTVAHELNNLVTIILGHSEVLEDIYSRPGPARASTTAIQQAANGIAAVTRQLVTLSGMQVLQPTTVDLNKLLKQATPKLRSLVPASVELGIILQPALGTTLVDAVQMEQAIFDIVRYCCDRMPGGGRLEITTANVTTEGNYRARHVMRYVELTIADSGPSLRGLTTEAIIQPSWNADPGRPPGFGLFAVRTVVAAAKGHLAVETETDEGAKFVLLLPRIEGGLVKEAEQSTVEAPRQPSLLLVEDDHAIRILLRNSFEQHGYVVIEARDGAEALLQSELHEESIDLLITDVVMPTMDGPALVRNLAATRPEMKVLLISGCPAELADVQELVQRGAHFYQKPFSQRELMARVETILRSDKP